MLNDSRTPIPTLRPRTLSAPLRALRAPRAQGEVRPTENGCLLSATAESTENRAGFGEGLHAGNAELASKPRQLEAAKGRLWVVDQFVDHRLDSCFGVGRITGLQRLHGAL